MPLVPAIPRSVVVQGPATRLGLTYDRLAAGLFAATLVLIVATFQDYGISWDEDVHFAYGYDVIHFYTSFFKDLSALNWQPLCTYGGLFDATTALLAGVSPFGGYETRHLLNAVVGLGGVVGVWKLTRELGGPRAGFWAAVLLLLTPNYYGHMFNNPKDVPLAAAGVWALYYTVKILPSLPRPRWQDAAKLGLAIGVACGIRVGGLLFAAYVGLAVAVVLGMRQFPRPRPAVFLAESLQCLVHLFLPLILTALPVMFVFWPWGLVDPLHNPLAALTEFSHHAFPYLTLFDGRYYPAPQLPRSYLPVHILFKLPELSIILLIATPILWGWWWSRGGRTSATTVVQHGIVAFAVVFPVVYAMAIRAVLFDGMRHFLFVIPPIVCLAALAAHRIASAIRGKMLRTALAGLMAVYGVYHLSVMMRLHPDEYVYYNAFEGGLQGAAGRFKLDYWANSYREAVLGLRRYLHDRDGVAYAQRTYHVAVCGPPVSADYFFPRNFIYEADYHQADFYIAFTKDNCHKSVGGREILRVERMDVTLSVVLALRGG